MNHIVLLGDSVSDNAAYVAGGPDVVRQLREVLPAGWRATLQARDGAVIAELAAQLQRLPADVSHLVVSVGGNDALGEAALLDAKVDTVVRERFRSAYARMLDEALGARVPLAVCTIYEPRFPEPVLRRFGRPLTHAYAARRRTALSRKSAASGLPDCRPPS